jgi:hypothetical protein
MPSPHQISCMRPIPWPTNMSYKYLHCDLTPIIPRKICSVSPTPNLDKIKQKPFGILHCAVWSLHADTRKTKSFRESGGHFECLKTTCVH